MILIATNSIFHNVEIQDIESAETFINNLEKAKSLTDTKTQSEGAKKFYISDLHFGHKNAIAFDNRPFFTVEEMNQKLIENWNRAVSKNDHVYVLGDMFWDNSIINDTMKQLNGNKYLIKGNHDRINSEMKKQFVWIKDYDEITDGENHVVLCHYPIPCYKNHFYGWHHLYGHVHNSFENNMIDNFKYQMTSLYLKKCSMFNVGCMMPCMNYTPRTLDEILNMNRED